MTVLDARGSLSLWRGNRSLWRGLATLLFCGLLAMAVAVLALQVREAHAQDADALGEKLVVEEESASGGLPDPATSEALGVIGDEVDAALEALDAETEAEAAAATLAEEPSEPLAISAPALALPGLTGRTDITVTGGEFEPIPVAIPRFRAVSSVDEPHALLISDVIAANLERSGLFEIIGGPPLDSIDVPPDIAGWSARGAVALIAGEVLLEDDGRLEVRFRLWDLRESEQRRQLRFLAPPSGARRVAHKVADLVYTEFTGEDAYFDSRIVFVDVRGPKEDRRSRLAIMDSDGANVDYLTDDEHLVLTPRFSPQTQEITFVSDRDGLPEVYLLNLITLRQERLGAFPGMSFAPRFSPDGEYVVLSLANEDGTDIYLLRLATRNLSRLTSTSGIDTAPSFSPDGRRIVFESDRAGGQQIYAMNWDGSAVERISSGPGRYATPVWSPKGDWIAFTKYMDGRFFIGVMRPDGSEERLLTSSYLDEGPTWAPNGRVLMFFREPPGNDGVPQLYTVDIYGRGVRPLPTPNGASDPAWSPLLEN